MVKYCLKLNEYKNKLGNKSLVVVMRLNDWFDDDVMWLWIFLELDKI